MAFRKYIDNVPIKCLRKEKISLCFHVVCVSWNAIHLVFYVKHVIHGTIKIVSPPPNLRGINGNY